MEKSKKIDITKLVTISMVVIILIALIIAFSVNFESIQTRYLTTFKSQKQYMTILSGLGNTMLITVLAFIIGISLGLITCLVMNINSINPVVIVLKNIFKAYVAIFRGTPMVVQLLIIYFVIFSNSKIEPLYVAIISFG